MTGHDRAPGSRIDTSKPHPARMYDWWLGGKDNYPVDEEMGRKLLAIEPRIPIMARANRAFMQRATRWLAQHGITQFLDIGSGIPTEPNLHQIAQRTAPEARVVYCDNDPIVLAHAEALLRSTPEGRTAYLQADVRDPADILERARDTLDFTRPVALSLIALLHFITDEDGAYDLVDAFLQGLPTGSYLMLSHGTGQFTPKGAAEADELYKNSGITLALRDRHEVERFFHGLELVDPGVAVIDTWHPELGEPVEGQQDFQPMPGFGAVARKV
ncbi:SAM-dependent methyltransferase [Streptomyces sp. NA04227]|uniref:SAM-dependent methyltransferase n=1 Tax=Streptomyces sp. NA04227 TaxID=2742136 RepID=UPI00158FF517|nr:SAM-dependent methyltransferase [Streptomyces sp. NA04227]QKW05879.1 SAM-dependent methyltransferase [Streptomyces sp. NA04227]